MPSHRRCGHSTAIKIAAAFAFDEEDIARIADPELRATLDTLRRPALDGKERPLPPVAFEPPADTDAETVQLHLEHPLVRRLLGRFVNQGLVHHDLSRTCLAISPDAQPRVVLMGRLSLWGEGATRLHEEIVRVAARWIEAEIRKTILKPYAREAERETMMALDRALDEPERVKVPDGVVQRLLRCVERDIAELLPVLEERGQQAEADAVEKLALRAEQEAKAMRELIEAQRRRIERELSDPLLVEPNYGRAGGRRHHASATG